MTLLAAALAAPSCDPSNPDGLAEDPLDAGVAAANDAGAGSVDEASEPVFTVEFVTVNQARAVQALTGYMAEQLGQDLAELIRPRGSQ